MLAELYSSSVKSLLFFFLSGSCILLVLGFLSRIPLSGGHHFLPDDPAQ